MTEPNLPQQPGRGGLIRLGNLRAAALNGKGLAQSLPQGFSGRWTRRHWVHASLIATLGALVLAIVPGYSNSVAAHSTRASAAAPLATLALALPPLSRSTQRIQPAQDWQIVSVGEGETLSHVFDRLGIPQSMLQRVLDQPGVRESLTRLRPGDELAFDLTPGNEQTPATLHAFRYDRDDVHRIELHVDGDGIRERVIERPLEIRTAVISGKVGRSLFHSARKLGLSGNNIRSLTDEIFQYDIDFNTDVAASDRFSVVVEQTWREGEMIRSGPILAATFTAHGDPYTGFRFEREGKAEYFSADGRPLKKSFIRMPIQYARLSSKFGKRRHPVLGTMRMHNGVDYAAASGTPIMAAGDGRVKFMGWKGGYGRAVVLDHGKGHTTLYAHMSGFGKIKTGQRVAQGDVIGRVGSTGLATGPHLHYEFRVNGAHRNPLSVTMPPPEPLSGAQLAAFRAQTGPALARIRQYENIIYAEVGEADEDRRVAVASAPRASKG